MGYSTQSKGYKLWDPDSKKIIVSRLSFRERHPPDIEHLEIYTGDNYFIDRGEESVDRINFIGKHTPLDEHVSTSESSHTNEQIRSFNPH